MSTETRNGAFARITLAATAAQIAMVVIGHGSPAVALWFGPLGMAISLVAGLWLALAERTGWRQAGARGALSGGACALVGIAVSLALGDVTPALLLLGTLSSAVAGSVGGLVGRKLRRGAGDRALAA